MKRLLKATRASSNKNEGLTFRTNDIINHFNGYDNFQYDSKIILTLRNGTRVVGSFFRNGETVYIPLKSVGRGIKRLPRVGNPIFLDVVEIEEVN